MDISHEDPAHGEATGTFGLMLAGCLLSALIVGLLIPSGIVASSPLEFVDDTAFVHPYTWLSKIFVTAAGIFLFWPIVLYRLGTEKERFLLSVGMSGFSIVAILQWLLFSDRIGTMDNLMVFDVVPVYFVSEIVIDLILVIAILAGVWFFADDSRKRAGC